MNYPKNNLCSHSTLPNCQNTLSLGEWKIDHWCALSIFKWNNQSYAFIIIDRYWLV